MKTTKKLGKANPLYYLRLEYIDFPDLNRFPFDALGLISKAIIMRIMKHEYCKLTTFENGIILN